MRRLLLLLGAVLNLAVVFGPLWWRYGFAPWSRPELSVVSIGITLFFLADCDHAEAFAIRPVTPHDQRAIRLAYAMGIGLLLTLWGSLFEFAERAQSMATWQICSGSLIMLGGAFLRRLAVRTLGREFVTEITPRADQTLVETGIYAHLRHPSETAILMMVAGVALTLGSRFGIAVGVLGLLPLILFRLRLEDQQLAAIYGQRHMEYVDRVHSLVPPPLCWWPLRSPITPR